MSNQDIVTPAGTPHAESQSAILALGAMILLLVGALLLSGSEPQADRLQAIETGADHITASELSQRIMAGGDGLLLIDVRPPEEFAQFHLPRALRMSVPDLVQRSQDLQLAARELVVLYSNGPAHAAQAWVELTALGLTNVRVLDGGIAQFQAEVLTPASLRDGTDEATAKLAAATESLVRAYFLSGATASRAATVWSTDPEQLSTPTMVSPAWLAARLGKVKVLDVRASASAFAALHVPNAAHFPEQPLRVQHGDRTLFLAEPQEIGKRLAAAGISDGDEVVIYADEKPQDATLVALALLHAGHQRLAILEGGLLRWAAEQRPMVAGAASPTAAQYQVAASREPFVIGAEELHQQLSHGLKVLDVRSAPFFRGEKSTEARPGHIPGALNRDYTLDFARTAQSHSWRDRAELVAAYQALGLSADDPIAVSCRTGHQASTSYFLLRYLLGYRNVRWYNGSWTDWAERKELPAALGTGS